MPDNTNVDTRLLMPDGAAITATTAGALLKAARQQAGLHLAILSVNLKVPVRQLEALEADQYAPDQSPVFVRALASSVCRQLRVDPAPILALMPMSANYLEPHGSVRYAHAPDLGRVRGGAAEVSIKAWWAAGAMVVLIAALIWAPHPSQWLWLKAVAVAVSPLEPKPEPVANVSTPAHEVISQNTQAIADPSLVGGQGGQAPLPLVIPGTSDTPSAAMVAAVSSLAQAVPELHFNALNTSWVEVRDSQNQLMWNGVMNKGDSKRLQAPQSVSVVVGRADAIEVSFKGQPVDLTPHTKVNVARFEVKP